MPGFHKVCFGLAAFSAAASNAPEAEPSVVARPGVHPGALIRELLYVTEHVVTAYHVETASGRETFVPQHGLPRDCTSNAPATVVPSMEVGAGWALCTGEEGELSRKELTLWGFGDKSYFSLRSENPFRHRLTPGNCELEASAETGTCAADVANVPQAVFHIEINVNWPVTCEHYGLRRATAQPSKTLGIDLLKAGLGTAAMGIMMVGVVDNLVAFA